MAKPIPGCLSGEWSGVRKPNPASAVAAVSVEFTRSARLLWRTSQRDWLETFPANELFRPFNTRIPNGAQTQRDTAQSNANVSGALRFSPYLNVRWCASLIHRLRY